MAGTIRRFKPPVDILGKPPPDPNLVKPESLQSTAPLKGKRSQQIQVVSTKSKPKTPHAQKMVVEKTSKNDEIHSEPRQGGRYGRRPETDQKAKALAGKKGRRRMEGDLEAMRCSDI